jgi:PTH2 family peptidyl-tRNA hydrolase
MRKGKLAAQVAHASMGTLTFFLRKVQEGFVAVIPLESPMYKWLEGRFVKIVVSCDSEQELFGIQAKCVQSRVLHRLITDAGLTEFHGVPTNTCIAVGPDEDEKIDSITGHLKLL